MYFPMYGTVLRFRLNLQKIIMNCAMMDKMVWDERMSPFKQVHII